MIRAFTIILLALQLSAVRAQNCQEYPAPCPLTSAIAENRESVGRMENKNCFPQDIAMETACRDLITTELERLAQKHQWKVYLVNEDGQTGPPTVNVLYGEWQTTPFNKRPPHKLRLSYIVVVSEDSLNAWRNWITGDFATDMQAQLDGLLNNRESDPTIKRYQDSVQKYLGLYNSYVQSHDASFQKDVKNNNQAGIDAYQKKTQAYLDKSDLYQKKLEEANEHAGAGMAASEANQWKRLADYAQKSFALVHFSINPYTAGFAIEDPGQVGIMPQQKMNIPGALYAGITKNPQPIAGHDYELDGFGFLLQNPAWAGTVLFGKYLAKTSYNMYPAAFAAGYNKRENVIGTVKAIPADKVQTMMVHVEGGKEPVALLMKEIDWQKLRSLMYAD